MATVQDSGSANAGVPGFIDAQLEAMSPRDRKLLIGLFVFMALIFCTFLWVSARSVLNDKASRVEAASDNLELLEAMAGEVSAADARVARGEKRMAQFANTALSAYVEQVARTTGVQEQLSGVNEQGTAEVDGAFRKSRYRVELRRVQLAGALGFIHELESAGYPLSIELARLKTVMDGPNKVVDLTLEIVAFQVQEAG